MIRHALASGRTDSEADIGLGASLVQLISFTTFSNPRAGLVRTYFPSRCLAQRAKPNEGFD